MSNTAGTLFVVSTPIGNLEDLTLRAMRVLREVPLIVAEDTRTARRLLAHHGIPAPKLLSYTEHNRRERIPAILGALEHGDVALVSEAGTPAVSDPGFDLVAAAIEAGHAVVPVPGASALLAALVAAGLPARRFHYLGFLPRRAGERRRALAEVAGLPDTLVAFESPRRVRRTLEDVREALGDRRIAVCREMTKLHEEVFRGTVSEAIARFSEPRGEFTLVIEGAGERVPQADAAAIDEQLRALRARGMRARDAVREVAERTGASHRDVYGRWLMLRRP
jgi:16S rRNA (cytidine1402-2'-O)-methyltransferase